VTVLQGISAMLSHAGNVSQNVNTEPVADGEYNPPSGLRLLSLDGGGVRGLFTVCVLQKLMEAIPKREGSENRVQRPCDVFDIIAGTSTGGLLAIMLGRLQMDATSCKEKYISMSRTIFQPQGWSLPGKRWIDLAAGNPSFTGDALKEAICSVTDSRMTAEEKDELRVLGKVPDQATLFSRHQSRARTFVCAIREDVTECERLRTYLPINPRPEQHDLDPRSVLIWEAGRATSAAPTYFPSIQIANREYFDGGMQSNNPILELVDEAHREHGRDAQIDAIVSIGTGYQSGGRPGPHIVDTIKHVLSRTTDAEAKHREFCSRLDYRALKEKYYRFQEFDRLGGIDLAAADKIEEIELIADEYLDSYEGKRMIRDCASLLDSH
jgi:predicted acylesterase/phospholipase RssA